MPIKGDPHAVSPRRSTASDGRTQNFAPTLISAFSVPTAAGRRSTAPAAYPFKTWQNGGRSLTKQRLQASCACSRRSSPCANSTLDADVRAAAPEAGASRRNSFAQWSNKRAAARGRRLLFGPAFRLVFRRPACIERSAAADRRRMRRFLRDALAERMRYSRLTVSSTDAPKFVSNACRRPSLRTVRSKRRPETCAEYLAHSAGGMFS